MRYIAVFLVALVLGLYYGKVYATNVDILIVGLNGESYTEKTKTYFDNRSLGYVFLDVIESDEGRRIWLDENVASFPLTKIKGKGLAFTVIGYSPENFEKFLHVILAPDKKPPTGPNPDRRPYPGPAPF